MAEAVVVAGAQQREREPEVAFQRRQPVDERALAPHLGEVASAVTAPETGDLRAVAGKRRSGAFLTGLGALHDGFAGEALGSQVLVIPREADAGQPGLDTAMVSAPA